jgi:hypothetical protein
MNIILRAKSYYKKVFKYIIKMKMRKVIINVIGVLMFKKLSLGGYNHGYFYNR